MVYGWFVNIAVEHFKNFNFERPIIMLSAWHVKRCRRSKDFQSAGKPAQICDRTGAFVSSNTPRHMGRSEAPLPSDSNGEESLEEPTANVHTRDRRRCSHSCVSGDYGRAFIRVVERIRGVDSKYNEQDGAASKPAVTQFRLLSLQTHPKNIEYFKRDRTGKEMNKHTL